MPARIRVRFYLEQSTDVHVLVREQEYKTYYWLDRVKPSRPWQHGFENVFEWSTQDVVQALGGLEIYDLGVIVRLVQLQHIQRVQFLGIELLQLNSVKFLKYI